VAWPGALQHRACAAVRRSGDMPRRGYVRGGCVRACVCVCVWCVC
jgi:hypothetical protein